MDGYIDQSDYKLLKTNVVYFDSVSNLWYVGGTVMMHQNQNNLHCKK